MVAAEALSGAILAFIGATTAAAFWPYANNLYTILKVANNTALAEELSVFEQALTYDAGFENNVLQMKRALERCPCCCFTTGGGGVKCAERLKYAMERVLVEKDHLPPRGRPLCRGDKMPAADQAPLKNRDRLTQKFYLVTDGLSRDPVTIALVEREQDKYENEVYKRKHDRLPSQRSPSAPSESGESHRDDRSEASSATPSTRADEQLNAWLRREPNNASRGPEEREIWDIESEAEEVESEPLLPASPRRGRERSGRQPSSPSSRSSDPQSLSHMAAPSTPRRLSEDAQVRLRTGYKKMNPIQLDREKKRLQSSRSATGHEAKEMFKSLGGKVQKTVLTGRSNPDALTVADVQRLLKQKNESDAPFLEICMTNAILNQNLRKHPEDHNIDELVAIREALMILQEVEDAREREIKREQTFLAMSQYYCKCIAACCCNPYSGSGQRTQSRSTAPSRQTGQAELAEVVEEADEAGQTGESTVQTGESGGQQSEIRQQSSSSRRSGTTRPPNPSRQQSNTSRGTSRGAGATGGSSAVAFGSGARRSRTEERPRELEMVPRLRTEIAADIQAGRTPPTSNTPRINTTPRIDTTPRTSTTPRPTGATISRSTSADLGGRARNSARRSGGSGAEASPRERPPARQPRASLRESREAAGPSNTGLRLPPVPDPPNQGASRPPLQTSYTPPGRKDLGATLPPYKPVPREFLSAPQIGPSMAAQVDPSLSSDAQHRRSNSNPHQRSNSSETPLLVAALTRCADEYVSPCSDLQLSPDQQVQQTPASTPTLTPVKTRLASTKIPSRTHSQSTSAEGRSGQSPEPWPPNQGSASLSPSRDRSSPSRKDSASSAMSLGNTPDLTDPGLMGRGMERVEERLREERRR